MSEQERQRRLVKLKLEERRLRKEGQLDELQKLLGEGFEMDANLRKLMGENKARFVLSLESRFGALLIQCCHSIGAMLALCCIKVEVVSEQQFGKKAALT